MHGNGALLGNAAAVDHFINFYTVFFKAIDSRRMSDPGNELQKVLTFRKELEESKDILYHAFDHLSLFENLLRTRNDANLARGADESEPERRIDLRPD